VDPSARTQLFKLGAKKPEARKDMCYKHRRDKTLDHTKNGCFHFESTGNPLQDPVFASYFDYFDYSENPDHPVESW
jgi:hypothetical protein